MSDSVFITSHLVVGGDATTLRVPGPTGSAHTAEQAISVMDSGATAILPEGDYDLAEQVLIMAGLSPEAAAHKVQSAQGGGTFSGFTPVPA